VINTKQPIEYFRRPDIIAAAIFPPEPDSAPTHSKGGETDVAHLASVERMARLSDDGDVVVVMAGATYRGRHVKGVGSVVCAAETGHRVCKSSMRMIRRAFMRLQDAAERGRTSRPHTVTFLHESAPDGVASVTIPAVDDDERTQVYHPGAAVLMTAANGGAP
jgi:hypothetical protein